MKVFHFGADKDKDSKLSNAKVGISYAFFNVCKSLRMGR